MYRTYIIAKNNIHVGYA